MATTDDLNEEQPNREFAEEASLVKTGLTQPALGPSDSSDSASDAPAGAPDTDSDRNNTGDEGLEEDIEPDHIVDETDAGLAYTPPNPERNGG